MLVRSHEEVKELLANEGKFEAKISNETVFIGGKDIKYVCKSSDCSGISTTEGCSQLQDGSWVCTFRFSITLSLESAERFANATGDLPTVVKESGREYLNESIYLFLDGDEIDSLEIAAELGGKVQQDIAISGPGYGATQQEAIVEALKNMKKLQSVMTTGSLPITLTIEKTDALSPSLGKEFLENSFLIGLIAIIVVGVIVFIRYREWKVTLTMMIMVASEIIIILGVAAMIGWNIDPVQAGRNVVELGFHGQWFDDHRLKFFQALGLRRDKIADNQSQQENNIDCWRETYHELS